MFIFSPMQFKEFGFSFYKGKQFAYRYRENTRFLNLWKSIFIPFGPIAETKNGFLNFLKHITKKNYNRITIPLPLILDKDILSFVNHKFKKFGFKKKNYTVHEDETLLTLKEEYNPSKKTRYKINKSLKNCRIELIRNPSSLQLKTAYNVYREFSEKRKIYFRPYEVFDKLATNSLLGIAYKKSNNKPIGFILGYIFEINTKGFLKTKNKANLLQIMFSGTNEEGRKNLAGYGLRDTLIKSAFEKYNIEIVDSLGASRTWNEPYLQFKKEFASKFVSLPGNFVRTKYFI